MVLLKIPILGDAVLGDHDKSGVLGEGNGPLGTRIDITESDLDAIIPRLADFGDEVFGGGVIRFPSGDR